jgi:hypothetical protein
LRALRTRSLSRRSTSTANCRRLQRRGLLLRHRPGHAACRHQADQWRRYFHYDAVAYDRRARSSAGVDGDTCWVRRGKARPTEFVNRAGLRQDLWELRRE